MILGSAKTTFESSASKCRRLARFSGLESRFHCVPAGHNLSSGGLSSPVDNDVELEPHYTTVCRWTQVRYKKAPAVPDAKCWSLATRRPPRTRRFSNTTIRHVGGSAAVPHGAFH